MREYRASEKRSRVKPAFFLIERWFEMEITKVCFVYILYSQQHDRYYIGSTSNLKKRLEEHNGNEYNGYTSKFKPWTIIAAFQAPDRASALRAEYFIKNQKTKTILEKLIKPEFIPFGELECLKRIEFEEG